MARRRRKTRLPQIIGVLVVIIMLIVAMPYINELTDNSSKEGEAVVIVVPEGASTDAIGRILKENGLIKSVNIFKLRAHLSDNGTRMNYGTFSLHKGMCIKDIIDTLAGQYSYRPTVTLTVPEGFSVEQIAVRCEEIGICSEKEFYDAMDDDYDYWFLKSIPDDKDIKCVLQGFLYPETYEFYLDATAHEVIDRMLAQFEKEISGVNMGNDAFRVVTIASILEREALLDSEMPMIAGVINNRLEKGMRLQVDACVQYAVSDGYYNVNRITYDDLEINSPYNTYRIAALPAGPICNPSITAIKAALNPKRHDYLYYHTDTQKNDGSHIFTKTYDEHLSTQ